MHENINRTTHPIIQAYRGTRIVTHTLVGLALTLSVIPICSQSAKQRLTRWWCAGLLKCLNIRVNAFGQLPYDYPAGRLIVANHISWVDIHALNSISPMCFVAKSDIKKWPVFGYLASKSGTLFINRNNRKDALNIIEALQQRLKNGINACYFPEGTTTDGTHILPFKSSIMQAAISVQTDIIPVAIRYPLADRQPDTRLAYAGDTTLMESIRNILRIPKPIIELHFLEPIPSNGQHRQSVNSLARHAISQHLGLR